MVRLRQHPRRTALCPSASSLALESRGRLLRGRLHQHQHSRRRRRQQRRIHGQEGKGCCDRKSLLKVGSRALSGSRAWTVVPACDWVREISSEKTVRTFSLVTSFALGSSVDKH